MKITDEIKVGENPKFIFYKNIFTKDYQDGYKILVAKAKENSQKEYLLLKDNKPIYASQQIEQVWNHYQILNIIKNKKK